MFSISVVMMARLMLNIHESASQDVMSSTHVFTTELDDIRFQDAERPDSPAQTQYYANQ